MNIYDVMVENKMASHYTIPNEGQMVVFVCH